MTLVTLPPLKLPGWLLPGRTPSPTPAEVDHATRTSKNWLVLSKALPVLTERQLLVILVVELATKRRPIVLVRARNRFLTVRAGRELRELTGNFPELTGVRWIRTGGA